MSRLTSETADCILPIRSLSNDLFADFWCRTNNRLCDLIRIPSGYNDAYFFDHVNAEDRLVSCRKCGDEYAYRWTRAGVLLAHVGIDKASAE